VYIDQAHQQFKLTTTREEEQNSNSKSERQENRIWCYSALRQHIRTNIPILCGPWPCCLYHTTVTYNLPLTYKQTLKTSVTWVYYRRTLCPSSFWKKNPDIDSGTAGYISSEEIYQFFVSEFSRPSNFLFQTARDSGATLSECPFSPKKCTSLKDLFKKDHFKVSLWKNPDQACSLGETWRNKKAFEFNHETLRGLSIRDP
jgi:hypothetical protein